MRPTLFLLLCAALLAGCKNPRSTEEAGTNGQPSNQRAEKSARKQANNREGSGAMQATAVDEVTGKIASVNPILRFVVVDFALNPLPKVDQRLSLYRKGQKVGEIKISPQGKDSIIAADITAGDAMVGDEVRSD